MVNYPKPAHAGFFDSLFSPLSAGRLRLLALFVAALLILLNFQSISLDDFDSVSFALALDRYDITLQQPHPPGFPVYVAAARALRQIQPLTSGDARRALTLLSAISGAVAVTALASIGQNAGGTRAGLLAGLALLSLPAFWLTGDLALSDVPGLALVLVAVACFWRASQYSSRAYWLIAGGALAGLCLGLRPQTALPAALFGIYASLVRLRTQRAALRWIGLAGVVCVLAVLLWLIPTINSTGGWAAYQRLVSTHSQHVLGIDSLFAQPVNGQRLTERVGAFTNGLLMLAGRNSAASAAAAQPGQDVLMIAEVALLVIGLARVRWRSALPLLCTLWFLIDASQVFLLESLERPRLYLTFVPPLLVLAALGWTNTPWRIRVPRFMLPLAVLLVCGASLLSTLPKAAILTQQATPPAQAAQYIRDHFPIDQTVIVVLGSFRHTQYLLDGYPQLYLGQFDAMGWQNSMVARQPVYLVLLDRDDVWPEAYAAVTAPGGYVPVEDSVFRRDPAVFPQHSLVRMQVLTPVKLLSPDQLALPSSGEIRVGDESSGKYFGEGWYRAEDVAGSAARWAQQTAVIRAALPLVDMTLTLEAVPFPANQQVSISVNDQLIGTVSLNMPWQAEAVTIPASALQGHAISTITLRHQSAQVPFGSDRALAAAYRVLRFSH